MGLVNRELPNPSYGIISVLTVLLNEKPLSYSLAVSRS